MAYEQIPPIDPGLECHRAVSIALAIMNTVYGSVNQLVDRVTMEAQSNTFNGT
jgi:hypothetical protein